jgi:hypothetical protein
MLNRTNLTLSARTLSNRLNLGTRSLALVAGVNHGVQNSRIRQTHHDVLREGMVWYDVFPIMPARYGIPTNPGSFSRPQQGVPSCALAQPAWPAAAIRVEPETRPADLLGRHERGAEVGVPRFPWVAVAPRQRRLSGSMLACELRPEGKSLGKPGWKRSAGCAAKSAAGPAARMGK